MAREQAVQISNVMYENAMQAQNHSKSALSSSHLIMLLGKPYLAATEGSEHAHQDAKKYFSRMVCKSSKSNPPLKQTMDLMGQKQHVCAHRHRPPPPSSPTAIAATAIAATTAITATAIAPTAIAAAAIAALSSATVDASAISFSPSPSAIGGGRRGGAGKTAGEEEEEERERSGLGARGAREGEVYSTS